MEDALFLFSPDDVLSLLLVLTGVVASAFRLRLDGPAVAFEARDLQLTLDDHNVNPRFIDAYPAKAQMLALRIMRLKLSPSEHTDAHLYVSA